MSDSGTDGGRIDGRVAQHFSGGDLVIDAGCGDVYRTGGWISISIGSDLAANIIERRTVALRDQIPVHGYRTWWFILTSQG